MNLIKFLLPSSEFLVGPLSSKVSVETTLKVEKHFEGVILQACSAILVELISRASDFHYDGSERENGRQNLI